MQDITEKGQPKVVNGNETISLIHQQIQVDLSDGSFPLLTTRKVNFRQVVDELLWDISGSHSVNDAGSAKVFWDYLADADGNLPSVYGRFLTRFPRYNDNDKDTGEQIESSLKGEINQLGWIINELIDNPFSRRLVASLWHPANATVSKQPPCHVSLIFNVTGDASHYSLNLLVTQRSADVALGLVIDVPKWSLLVILLASYLNMNPGLVTFTIADAHIYEEHVEKLLEQIKREPTGSPYVRFDTMTLCDYTTDDIELIGYQPHPAIRYRLVSLAGAG